MSSSTDQKEVSAKAPEGEQPSTPVEKDRAPQKAPPPKVARAPAIIVTIVICAIVGLSLWYLVQPQPLIIQGEADATRIDIAARVDGRVGQAAGGARRQRSRRPIAVPDRQSRAGHQAA